MGTTSAAARARKRNPDGSFAKGKLTVQKNALSPDNTITSDHLAGNAWIANPHDVLAKAAPPGLTPIAPGVFHANIFRTISQVPSQVFRNLDEALRANRISAKAMINDGAIWAPISQRILHLVSCNDGLVPEDENDPEQMADCETLWNLVQQTHDWTEFKRTLAEAIWYGKCCNKVDYRWRYIKGERRMVCEGFTNIIGDKLVFRTNGQMGYIVHTPSGFRDLIVTDIGRAELFNDNDYECLVHHKYFMVDVPYDEGMLAIGQEGFGYRNFLYYLWWLKSSVLEFAMQGLQIFGNGGLRVAYFEESNPASMKAVADSVSAANGQTWILFPRPIGDEKTGAGIEIVPPQGLGLEWFKNFLDDYFGKQINQMLLGYDYEGTRKDLYAFLKYDAAKLSETIDKQFISVLQRYNMPSCKHKLTYKIFVPHHSPEMILTAAQRVYEMGGEVSQSEVLQLVGLSVPHKGKRILKKTEQEMLGGVAGMPGMNAEKSISSPSIEMGDLGRNLKGGNGVQHEREAVGAA
jgi:hypothetical protein